MVFPPLMGDISKDDYFPFDKKAPHPCHSERSTAESKNLKGPSEAIDDVESQFTGFHYWVETWTRNWPTGLAVRDFRFLAALGMTDWAAGCAT